MVQARQKYDWSHTSSMMALMAELKRNRRKQLKAFTPADFDPTKPKHEPDGQTMTVAGLAKMIPGAKYKPHGPNPIDAGNG